MTRQPVWRLVANLGDADPFTYVGPNRRFANCD